MRVRFSPVSAPPTWPAGAQLAATAVSMTSLNLSWTATHPVMTPDYVLYQDGGEILELPGTQTSATVTGLAPGRDYFFKIEAKDSVPNESESGPSLSISTLPDPAVPPTAPPLDPGAPVTMVTTYDYDAFGALREVTLPSGTQIEYIVDVDGNRRGTKVNGAPQGSLVYSGAATKLGPADAFG